VGMTHRFETDFDLLEISVMYQHSQEAVHVSNQNKLLLVRE